MEQVSIATLARTLAEQVDALIARQDVQAQQKREQQAREARETQARAATTLREQWEADFPLDVREQLAPTAFRLSPQGYALAHFTFDGEEWSAAAIVSRAPDAPRTWRFTAPEGHYTRDAAAGDIGPLVLILAQRRRDRLAAELAASRESLAQTRYDAALATAGQDAWRWPAGREIVLFRFTWHLSSTSEWGSSTERGWAVTDRHNRDGYLQFQAESDFYGGSGAAREVRVATLSPAPMVERRVFSRVEDLPPELREPLLVTLEPDEDFDRRSSHGDHQHRIGEQPVSWLRDLIDHK